MYNVITNQDNEIYVTDTNEILALDALTKKDLDLALENYLPLTAGIDKKLTGDLYVDNDKFIKGYTTELTLRNLIGVNTASDVELGDTNANINVKAASAFRPATNNEITLGTDTLQWKEIHGTTIYQDGKQVANKDDLTNLENNKVNITNSDTTQSIYNHIYNDINNQTIVSSAGADFDPMSEEDLPNSSYSSYFINNPMLQVIQNTYKDNEGNQTLTSISQSSGAITLQTQSQNGSSMINVGDGVTQIGDGNNFYNFENTSLNNTNNADLGTSTNKFKDLYLSGKLSNGTNEVTIDDITNKVDKIEGKGLSTEDFTTELKEKLVSIDTTIAQNTLSIGSVSSGTTASATITGTAPNQTLNLVLPKGDKGDTGEKGDKGEQGIQGDKGDKGDTGATPVITATSTTLPAGSSATVTKSGTAENPNFEFGIPKGDKGEKGDKGDSGLIYQTTGQNTDGAMSQKATTDALNGKANLSGGNAFTGTQTFDNIIVKNEIKAPAAFDLYLQNGSDRVTKFGKNGDGILWSDGKITTTGVRIGSWLINQDSSGNLIFS